MKVTSGRNVEAVEPCSRSVASVPNTGVTRTSNDCILGEQVRSAPSPRVINLASENTAKEQFSRCSGDSILLINWEPDWTWCFFSKSIPSCADNATTGMKIKKHTAYSLSAVRFAASHSTLGCIEGISLDNLHSQHGNSDCHSHYDRAARFYWSICTYPRWINRLEEI